MIKSKLLAATATSIMLLFITGTAQANNTVMFDEIEYTVFPDAKFTVEVDGMGFNPLDAGGFNIAWDPNVLELAATLQPSVVIDPLWEFFPALGDSSTPGQLNGVLFNTLSFNQPTGDFDIADITFHVIGGAGESSFLMLSESNFNPFSGPDGMNGLNFMASTVNVVPEMEVWAMMLAGMGLLAWKTRRLAKQDEDTGALHS